MLQDDDPGFALYEAVGWNIRSLRRKHKWTQIRLAETLGYSRAAIANIEAGRQRVALDMLYDIADLFDVQARDLLPPNEAV